MMGRDGGTAAVLRHHQPGWELVGSHLPPSLGFFWPFLRALWVPGSVVGRSQKQDITSAHPSPPSLVSKLGDRGGVLFHVGSSLATHLPEPNGHVPLIAGGSRAFIFPMPVFAEITWRRKLRPNKPGF